MYKIFEGKKKYLSNFLFLKEAQFLMMFSQENKPISL